MKPFRKIIRGIFFDTYGAFAAAALIICILSGIVLAIPYNITAPHDSVIRIMLYNPPAVWFRNLHYWSAQVFLVLFILHLWDQFSLSGEKNVKPGVWISLVIAILFVFFAMLSGFILKGDADSMQARRILNDLVLKIPLAGNVLAYFFLGWEPGFQILYMQHIALATLFLVIITYEHARILWPRYDTLLVILLVTGLAALFLNAPLHDPHDPVLKGPWYFNGLQELLHWLKHPGLSILIIFLLPVLVWVLPYLKEKPNRLTKKALAYILIFYLMLIVIGYYFRGEAWQWKTPWQAQYKPSGQINATGGLVRSLITHTGYSYHDTIPASGKEGCIACHHQAGMDCIDCHTSYELMGDGKEHLHEEDQVTVRCEDCHTNRPYKWIKREYLDKEAGVVAQLLKTKADSFPLGTLSGNPLLNVHNDHEGSMMLQTKRTGKVLPLNPPASSCTRDSVHQSLTCSTCHTAWAPSCLGCHNQWDPAVKGFDMLHGNKPVTGSWTEYAGVMSADPPVLGVRTDTIDRHGAKKIVPAVPGMILTIDLHSYDPRADTTPLFHRLFRTHRTTYHQYKRTFMQILPQ